MCTRRRQRFPVWSLLFPYDFSHCTSKDLSDLVLWSPALAFSHLALTLCPGPCVSRSRCCWTARPGACQCECSHRIESLRFSAVSPQCALSARMGSWLSLPKRMNYIHLVTFIRAFKSQSHVTICSKNIRTLDVCISHCIQVTIMFLWNP